MLQTAPVATPVSAESILQALLDLNVTHVINVPDTHQRTLLTALACQSRIRLLTTCTEDEAIGVNAGLYIGHQRPILSIQQTGLLAAMNTLKGIAMDARIPTCMLVGYFGRDVTLPARQNAARVMNLIEPTLDTWGVPYFPLEGSSDLDAIARAYGRSIDDRGPSVVLIGAPTS